MSNIPEDRYEICVLEDSEGDPRCAVKSATPLTNAEWRAARNEAKLRYALIEQGDEMSTYERDKHWAYHKVTDEEYLAFQEEAASFAMWHLVNRQEGFSEHNCFFMKIDFWNGEDDE